jgi:plasmid stabilization system protein ParE
MISESDGVEQLARRVSELQAVLKGLLGPPEAPPARSDIDDDDSRRRTGPYL